MKKFLVAVFIILFITAVGAGGYLYYRSIVTKPLKPLTEKLSITVQKDRSLNSILDELDGKGILKSNQILKFYYKYSGYNLAIVPGTYQISSEVSADQLLKELRGENKTYYKVTIPEGFTVEKIAKALEEADIIKASEFIKATELYELPSYIPKKQDIKNPLEGYLFPSTYQFEKDTPADTIISTMLKQFETTIKMIENMHQTKYSESSYDETVIKASMIEREAQLPEERPVIASVINNRIAKDMKLQIDATVLYAIGVDAKEVLFKDMETNSPYNTYVIKGLPIGPICNPGLDSLKAALKPEVSNYIYYLAEPGTGKHYFTEDYAEFEKKKIEFYGAP